MFSVAIDGPSGAGKSTLARTIAKELGFLYADTGALYRAIGLAVLRAEKNTKNAANVAAVLKQIKMKLCYLEGKQCVFLNGEDISEAIRAEEVSMAASDVSAHAVVRDYLLETQCRLARENNVIMDGRDIGTVVLPDANLKIYLTATVEDRANRRYKQLLAKGEDADYETIKKDVQLRDFNDTSREIAPLKKADDAIEVNSTGETEQQSFKRLFEMIEKAYKGYEGG